MAWDITVSGHYSIVWKGTDNMSKILIILIPCILSFTMMAGCASVTDTQSAQFQNKYGDFDYCEFKAVKQAQDNSCGSACITAVLNYWGVDITEKSILEQFPKSSFQGYSMQELKLIALQNGIEAYTISMEHNHRQRITDQVLKGRPVICAVEFPRGLYFAYDVPVYGHIYRAMLWKCGPRKNHYLVVFGTNRDRLLVMDPAYGFAALNEDDFYSCWQKMNYSAVLCAVK